MSAATMFTVMILCVIARAAAELVWTTETLFTACCEGQDNELKWNFSKGENDIIRQLHWYYNKTTLICYHSESTGFHMTDLYKGRVERKGITHILLKNVSSMDTGEYTLYPKLAEEETENVQTISLTVYKTPVHKCKPTIKIHSRNILSCSVNSCGRQQLFPEWRILGIPEPVGNASYLKVNSSWKAEQVLCCPQSSIMNCYNGNQSEICTTASIVSTTKGKHLNEDLPDIRVPTRKDTEKKDHVILVPMIIVSVLLVMGIFLIAFIFYMWRKHKLAATMRSNAHKDEECLKEIHNLKGVSESTDQDLLQRNLNQRLQIVNNVNLDSSIFKGMFDSHNHLTADLHALRKENTKLQSHLEHALQFQKRQNVNEAWREMTVMVHRDANGDDTDTSVGMTDYEDANSDAEAFMIPGNGFVT